MSGKSPAVREAMPVYEVEASETERVPPGYKQTEVGVIPEDWEVQQLGSLGKWKGGMTPSMSKPQYWEVGAFPWVSSSDVTTTHIATTSLRISEQALKETSASLLPDHCVLIVTRSGILRRYLPVTLNTVRTAINQDIKALTPDRQVEAEYLLQVLLNDGPKILSRCLKSGTTVESIEFSWLQSYSIPLPPLPEQRAIAAALSDVDDLISALDKLIAKKRAVKTAAMQQLLTGMQCLPGFSGEWEVKTLDEVADVDPDNLPADTDSDYEFNYISLEDVDRGTLRDFSYQRFSSSPSRARRRLRTGDVLVSTVRPNLKSHLLFSVSEGNWVCSTGFSLVRCRKHVASAGFVYQHLFHGVIPKQIEALIAGSNYPAISTKDVRAFQIPMPSIEEQTAIATVLSDMDAEIEALEARR